MRLSTRNDDPQTASRPWDKDRDGFVLGEGAGVVVLEEYEHAKARGAKIYAELAGFGMSADAYHMTAPDVDGPRRSMVNALRNAGVNPDQVSYLNAHGTSTPLGDLNETNAVKAAFGDASKNLVVNSTKSMTGHLLGGAGGVESVFTVLAVQHQMSRRRSTSSTKTRMRLDYCANTARDMKIDVAILKTTSVSAAPTGPSRFQAAPIIRVPRSSSILHGGLSMHNAPSVSYPAGRSRFAAALLLLAWLMGGAVTAMWWLQSQSPGWRQSAAWLVLAAAGAFAAWNWWHSETGHTGSGRGNLLELVGRAGVPAGIEVTPRTSRSSRVQHYAAVEVGNWVALVLAGARRQRGALGRAAPCGIFPRQTRSAARSPRARSETMTKTPHAAAPTPADTDLMLVERTVAGDQKAFELLVIKYQRRIERLIGRMVRDTDLVEDIAQETFIRAYRALAQFRGESAFYTWLYRIAVNTAKKPWATSSGTRWSEVGPRGRDEEDRALGRERTNHRGNARNGTGQQTDRRGSELCDRGPCPKNCQAVTLREIEGLSYEEIAEVMNCPIGTVRSRIFRAREAIAARLRPLLDTREGERW